MVREMNKDTQTEVIKALAAGMQIIDIANFADTTESEIEQFAKENAKAISDRKKAMEEFGI